MIKLCASHTCVKYEIGHPPKRKNNTRIEMSAVSIQFFSCFYTKLEMIVHNYIAYMTCGVKHKEPHTV